MSKIAFAVVNPWILGMAVTSYPSATCSYLTNKSCATEILVRGELGLKSIAV